MANKGELYDLMSMLWKHGLRSPSLFAEALGISETYARDCLVDLGLTQPRDLPEFMCKLSDFERKRIAGYRVAKASFDKATSGGLRGKRATRQPQQGEDV
jgi:hypothetical protein